jgi:hypothetical protein
VLHVDDEIVIRLRNVPPTDPGSGPRGHAKRATDLHCVVNSVMLTVMGTARLSPLVSPIVATQVPALIPVMTRFQDGPEPLAAEKLAIGVTPPQLLVSLNVPV